VSFSRAGWFWRLGRREESRPVSVLRLREQWTRLWSSARVCSEEIKLVIMVSMEPIMCRE